MKTRANPVRFAVLALSLTLCTAGALRAATADNQNLWLNYVGDHPLFGSPWGLHLEVQNRLSDWGKDWQQLLLRPGINYQFTPNLSASLGYGFIRTFPYGELPAKHRFDEHRIWEQLVYKQDALGLKWTHRLRLEQRWIGEPEKQPDGRWINANWRGEQRVRYMLRTELPLSADKRWYVPVWNEAFLNFGGNILNNHFDQNRAFLGVGWKWTPTVKVEAGFLEQTVHKRGGGGRNWENNHTACVWLTSNLPFFEGFGN